jgi:hypothetical protein
VNQEDQQEILVEEQTSEEMISEEVFQAQEEVISTVEHQKLLNQVHQCQAQKISHKI